MRAIRSPFAWCIWSSTLRFAADDKQFVSVDGESSGVPLGGNEAQRRFCDLHARSGFICRTVVETNYDTRETSSRRQHHSMRRQ